MENIKKKNKVLVFGAGGHGRVVFDILRESKIEIGGFIDESKEKFNKEVIAGYKVLGSWPYAINNRSFGLALGIGNNRIRQAIYSKAKKEGVPIVSAIHPSAIISSFAKLGEGVVIMAGAVINAGAVLEEGVVVNTGATIDHDCILRRFSHVWPGAHLAGTVEIGEFSYVGTGVSIIQNLKVGKNTIIGAGAVVVSDIPEGVVAVGVPAKTKRRNIEK